MRRERFAQAVGKCWSRRDQRRAVFQRVSLNLDAALACDQCACRDVPGTKMSLDVGVSLASGDGAEL